jgi:hypothetical protein
MIHTVHNLTSNLNSDFEIQEPLGSLEHLINIIIRIRDTGCYIYSSETHDIRRGL